MDTAISWKFQQTQPDLPMEKYIFLNTKMGSLIATARQTVNALQHNHALTLRDWYIGNALREGMPLENTVGPEKVNARILYGRWLVDCPRCKGANDVDPADPVYLCSSCGWPGVFQSGHYTPPHFASVNFPRQRAHIERLLLKRPYIRNRNWNPGETLDELARQNIEHKDEV